MDLASAYNKLQPKVVNNQPRTSLAVKPNAQIVDLFHQAVALIEPNRWIKASPREIKKEDYYCYLKFRSDYDCMISKNKQNRKIKHPIFSVEKTVTGNDVFQYRNQKGELDMYIRPQTSQRISGFDCSDCFDDKKAFNRFKEYLTDESWVMKNLYGEQDHVFLGFTVSDRDYAKGYSIVLFKDGNAYCFKEPLEDSEFFNPYLEAIDLDSELCNVNQDSFVQKIAWSIRQFNKWGYEGRVMAPAGSRKRDGGCESGFYIDYLVYNGKSSPEDYQIPEDKRKEYQSMGRCTYCGYTYGPGTRMGDKCPVCGKKKDY